MAMEKTGEVDVHDKPRMATRRWIGVGSKDGSSGYQDDVKYIL
jgi:hypothetical protein